MTDSTPATAAPRRRPLRQRCQECLCNLCSNESRCPVCHGQGIGAWVREKVAGGE